MLSHALLHFVLHLYEINFSIRIFSKPYLNLLVHSQRMEVADVVVGTRKTNTRFFAIVSLYMKQCDIYICALFTQPIIGSGQNSLNIADTSKCRFYVSSRKQVIVQVTLCGWQIINCSMFSKTFVGNFILYETGNNYFERRGTSS